MSMINIPSGTHLKKTAEEKLGNEELKRLLKSALHTLSDRETLVFQLYYIEELNVFEIGYGNFNRTRLAN